MGEFLLGIFIDADRHGLEHRLTLFFVSHKEAQKTQRKSDADSAGYTEGDT